MTAPKGLPPVPPTPGLHLATLLVLIPRSGFTSDRQFCAAVGLDTSNFVKLKKGTMHASPSLVLRMAAALDVPVSVLARGVVE